jgi:hypothetical protein
LASTQEEAMVMSEEKQREKEKKRTLNGIPIPYLTSVFKSLSDFIGL